jgi:saccharopine dehydrogenase-like NADP-dependent oxidoreductase
VKGKKDGLVREAYLYQIADNQECVQKYDNQVVQAQTAFTPVITLELLAAGKLGSHPGDPKAGVHPPEEFCADDYVALMEAYEFPGGLLEMPSEYKSRKEVHALTAPLR